MALASEHTSSPTPPHRDNSGLYIIATVVVLALIGAVIYFLFQNITPPKKVIPSKPVESPQAETYAPPQPEPMAAAPEPPKPVTAEKSAPKMQPLRYVDYVVRKDDMLSLISKERYGTRYYWPAIYLHNKHRLHDQDRVMPGMVLEIPDRIDITDPTHLSAVTKGHIAAYRNYKKRGKRNKARWLLYACVRYVDPGFLQTYAKQIDATDMKVVKSYMKRFGKQR